MAYTEADKAKIKRWLGYQPLYNPELDAAIRATSSTGDGGSMPDSSVETEVKLWVTELEDLRTKIKALRSQSQVAGVGRGEATLDTIRGIASMAMEGRVYVGFIADALGVRPVRDVFTPSKHASYVI